MRRGWRGRLQRLRVAYPSAGRRSLGARASDAELALLLGGRWLHRLAGCLIIPPRACQGSPHRSLAPAHVKARTKKAARPSVPAKIEPPPRPTGGARRGLPTPSKSALHFYSPPQARSILASVLLRTLLFTRGQKGFKEGRERERGQERSSSSSRAAPEVPCYVAGKPAVV